MHSNLLMLAVQCATVHTETGVLFLMVGFDCPINKEGSGLDLSILQSIVLPKACFDSALSL